jgi:hypothetical protein
LLSTHALYYGSSMSPLFAITANTTLILALAAIASLLIGYIWLLVAAAQRGILWFLAVFFIGIAGLVLAIIEPRARAPFFLMILGVGLFVGAVVNQDSDKTKGMTTRQRMEFLFSDHDTKAGPSLAERQEHIRTWQKDLERKKAALKPNDSAGQAAFNEELNQYLAELQKVKDDTAKAKP